MGIKHKTRVSGTDISKSAIYAEDHEIEGSTIVTADIADNAITTNKIVDNAITSAKIAPDCIIAADIATGAVGSDELAAGIAEIPASYLIYKSDSTYYARNGQTGAIDYSGADASTVIQAAITASNGRVFIKKAIYSFPANTTINLVSNLLLESDGATISTPSQSYTQAWVFKGTSVENVTIRGFYFDGQQGTGVSGIEPIGFLMFYGCKNVLVENNQGERISGRMVGFMPPANSYIMVRNNKVGVEDGGASGGAGPTFDTVSNGIIEGEYGYFWDSGPLIARSSNIIISNNYYQARRGVVIDILAQQDTDEIRNVLIDDNMLIGPSDNLGAGVPVGQGAIAIHDQVTMTKTTMFNFQISNNIIDGKGHSWQGIGFGMKYPVEGLKISNNQIFRSFYGINFGSTTIPQRGVIIDGNQIYHIGDGSTYSTWGIRFQGPFLYGIISDNLITDVWSTGAYYDGMFSDYLMDGTSIRGNKIGEIQIGDNVSHDMRYALFFTSVSTVNLTIYDNDFVGTSIYVLGTPIIKRNFGYVTENNGTSTGTGAEQTIAHGLATGLTPNNVTVIPTVTGATVSSVWADATNIYCTVTSGKAYKWSASLV